LACIWLSEGTLSPSKFLLGSTEGRQGKGKGAAAFLPPFGAAHDVFIKKNTKNAANSTGKVVQ